MKILAIDEINAAQQNDPEDVVIEGELVVAGSKPPRGRIATSSLTSPDSTVFASDMSSPAFDLVASVLDQMAEAAAESWAGANTAAWGFNWLNQLGNGLSTSLAAESQVSQPAGPLAHSRGRVSWFSLA